MIGVFVTGIIVISRSKRVADSLPRLLRALPAEICVWRGRTGHFAGRRASSSRSMQKSEEHL
jgi:hypothetical protein